MADPPRSTDPGDDTGVGSDRGSRPGTPRWVKVLGIIAIVVVVLVVIVLLTGGGGGHGPGRHTPSDGLGGHQNTGVGGPAAADQAGMRGQITVA